jgi:DTW domain-containing protein YfiP
MSVEVPREECQRCAKPSRLCVCAALPQLANRTRIVVLQHPRERDHPLGTARFIELGLGASEVHVTRGLDASHVASRLPAGRTALLYPSPTSVLLDDLDPALRPETLVVLDGTWPQARTLYRANPWLAELPHVRLAPAEPSRYRIRKEPNLMCVSTLEATLHALRALEPDLEGQGALLAAFDGMIDAQIAEEEGSSSEPRKRLRGRRPFTGVPRALGEESHRLVLVYAEMSLRDANGERRMLRWTAVRFADGATFDAFITPSLPFAREQVPEGAPELARAVDAGESMEDAAARFIAFAGPDAIVGAWNGELAPRSRRFVLGDTLDLAAAYRACHGAGQGVLDRVAEFEGLAPVPLAIEGRAQIRLGNALALARHLHQQASERSAKHAAA